MNESQTSMTAIKLAEMLTEDTGRHFLDSGGIYGRHWEKNQGRDFATEPRGRLVFCNVKGKLDIESELSVYHFLADRLKYNPSLDTRYRDFAAHEGSHPGVWVAQDFVKSIGGRGCCQYIQRRRLAFASDPVRLLVGRLR